MKHILLLFFFITIALVGCRPKTASKEPEKKAPEEVKVEAAASVISSETERIDSISQELENSIKKLDEVLNDLE